VATAALILEDGTRFEGISFGAKEEVTGWVAPHTSMVGYQEIITDPSNESMILCMTYPLVGNYGVNREHGESYQGRLKGLVVRDLCAFPVHWSSEGSLHHFMQEEGVPGLRGVDTRALSRYLFQNGAQKGIITSSQAPWEKLYQKITGDSGQVEVRGVVDKETRWENDGPRLAVIDLGIRLSFIKKLHRRGFYLGIFPPSFTAADVKNFFPSGVVVAGGGGNPEKTAAWSGKELKQLMGDYPILGVSGGLQVLYVLTGGRLACLKTGHRGDNYPVKELISGKIYITSQNHWYQLTEPGHDSGWKVSYRNLHDKTVEGLDYGYYGLTGVQFWPQGLVKESSFKPQQVENFIQSTEGGV